MRPSTNLLADINGVGVALEDTPASRVCALPAEGEVHFVGVASGDVQIRPHRAKSADPLLERLTMWRLSSMIYQPGTRMAHLMRQSCLELGSAVKHLQQVSHEILSATQTIE